jgi:hypothetical protein
MWSENRSLEVELESEPLARELDSRGGKDSLDFSKEHLHKLLVTLESWTWASMS